MFLLHLDEQLVSDCTSGLRFLQVRLEPCADRRRTLAMHPHDAMLKALINQLASTTNTVPSEFPGIRCFLRVSQFYLNHQKKYHMGVAQEGDLRLVGRVDVNGFATGGVQVFRSGGFGAVCAQDFGNRDARVACRQLGFVSGRVLPSAFSFFGGETSSVADPASLSQSEVSFSEWHAHANPRSGANVLHISTPCQ